MARGRQGHRGYEMGPLQNKELNEAKRGDLSFRSTLWLDGWEGGSMLKGLIKKWVGCSSTPSNCPYAAAEGSRNKVMFCMQEGTGSLE